MPRGKPYTCRHCGERIKIRKSPIGDYWVHCDTQSQDCKDVVMRLANPRRTSA
jgi:hypothetical protein